MDLRQAKIVVTLLVLLAPLTAGADSLRVTSIEVLDEGTISAGSVGSLSVDLAQGLCGEAPDQSDEPFFDSVIATNIYNPTNLELAVKRVRYQMRITAGGRVVRSAALSPISTEVIAPRSTGRILSYYLKAASGAKKLIGHESPLDTELAIQHLRVALKVRSANGSQRWIRKRVSMAFGDYNRCGD